MKATTYYTLADRYNGRWAPQFGSYTKSEVKFELSDMLDHGADAADLVIIQTGDTQADIDAGIAFLNRELTK